MISKESPSKDVSCISRDHASEWAVVEVRVFGLALLKSVRRTSRKKVHVVVAGWMLSGHVVERHELVHVHSVGIAGRVKIASSV